MAGFGDHLNKGWRDRSMSYQTFKKTANFKSSIPEGLGRRSALTSGTQTGPPLSETSRNTGSESQIPSQSCILGP